VVFPLLGRIAPDILVWWRAWCTLPARLQRRCLWASASTDRHGAAWSFACRTLLCFAGVGALHVWARSGPPHFTWDATTACYALSAVAQSVAAIMGIGFSGLFIVGQLSAQHYTREALILVTRDWRTHYVLGLHLVTIAVALVLLLQVCADDDAPASCLHQPDTSLAFLALHENSVLFACCLAVTAALLLVMHTTYSLSSLSGTRLVERLARDVRREIDGRILREVHDMLQMKQPGTDEDRWARVERVTQEPAPPQFEMLREVMLADAARGRLDVVNSGLTLVAHIVQTYCVAASNTDDFDGAGFIMTARVLDAIDDFSAMSVSPALPTPLSTDGAVPLSLEDAVYRALWEVWSTAHALPGMAR